MRPRRSGGFTYLGLLILITVIGLVGAAGLKMGTLFQQAAAEEELLEIGAQFSDALRSYAAATPQGKPQQPPSLLELLKDPRFPNPRRHLRKIFVDPVTGKAEWGIIYLGDKVGVVGVYSLSTRRPLKIANFDIRFQNMENREHISDWKFAMAGGEGVNPAVLTPPNSMVGAGSLFAPGAPGGKPGTGMPGDAKPGDAKPGEGKSGEGKPGEGKAGDTPVPPGERPPQQPPPDDAPPPEPEQPADTPPDEPKQGDEAPEVDPTKDAASASSTVTKPVEPPPTGQPHKR